MDFSNAFRVNLPLGEAWTLLTDVERVAPCMPGARLTGAEGDVYTGVVKVKVGPVTVQYRGTASFTERDEATGTAVLHARGRDTRGQGNADATVTARLTADGDATHVTVDTRLMITGRIAQFGKGMIQEVSGKLLTQFVDNVEARLVAEREAARPAAPEPARGAPPAGSASRDGEAAPAASTPAASTPAESARAAAQREPEPLDLMSVAGGSILKRALPAVVALAAIAAVLALWLTR
jgi:carbon monoxide dehydrogenase subunit G